MMFLDLKATGESPRFTINRTDLESLGKGLLITMAGAALTYLTEAVGKVDLGMWTPMVVAGWSFVVNAARKWLQENSK